jgi:hypothetical protein
MTYSKPEVHILGNASAVIELINGVKQSATTDGFTDPMHVTPAYDLDE